MRKCRSVINAVVEVAWLLFSAHIYIMEKKSSTQNAEIERFFNVFANRKRLMCQSVRCSTALAVKIFHYQIIGS